MAIAPFLSAGVGLAQSLFNMNQQKQANNINWRALMETQRSNRKQEELATSAKTDAYGNKIYYVPGVGWQYELSPSTASVLSGEQRERLANLNEDAPRNRAAAKRMDERSQMADDEWTKSFNKYRFRTEPSEAEVVGDTRSTLLNARKRGLDEAASLVARQLLRSGGGSNLAAVYKSAGDQYADSLEDVDLKAKQVGGQLFRERRDSDAAAALRDLSSLRDTADRTTQTPVNFSNFNSELSQGADSALENLQRTLAGGSQATSRALANYSQGVGNTSLDLSGLARAFASLRGQEDEEEYYPPQPGSSNGLW